jgi:hypothetical protein
MAKQLAALLGGGLDLKALAEMLRRQGRGQDTILAHITPQEAALLKSRGGAGTMNPNTGLPEFQDDSENYGYGYGDEPYVQPVAAPNIEYGQRLGEGPMEFGNPLVISDLNDTMTPNQVFTTSSVSPQFEPAIQPSFRPSMNYGLGMYEGEMVGQPQVRDQKQAAIDRGQAPQRDMQDLVKSGAKQVLEGLKTRTGAALGQTALAALMARRGYKQARAMENELRQLGQAPRQVGQEQLGAGMRGELTPVQQQQIAAFQAQQRQALANMGQRSGTAQQQLGARTVEMQQRGAQDLINQGLKNIGISDKYLQQAIIAGYEADSAVGTALGNALRASGKLLAGEASDEVAKPVETAATKQRTPLSSKLGG